MKLGSPNLDLIKVSAKFYCFTNTTCNRMFIQHQANAVKSSTTKWVPVEIEVNTKRLQNYLKKIPRGTQLLVTLNRKTGGYGTTAELIRVKRIKKP